MNKPYSLEIEGAFGQYDQAKQILYIVYSGHLTAATTTKVYEWMTELLDKEHINPMHVSGALFDFQKVTDMEEANGVIAQGESQKLNQKFDLHAIPVAIIVGYNDLRGKLQEIVDRSPQPERKSLVLNIEEAFEFLKQFKLHPEQPSVNVLDTPQVTGQFDEDTHLAYITYYDVLTADVTADVYAWTGRVADKVNVKNIHTAIYDFRRVSRFDHTNTRKIGQSSGQLNVSYDFSHVAVALLVRDSSQEQIVRMMMHLTPQEKRKRIVKSLVEARAFLDEFRHETSNNPA